MSRCFPFPPPGYEKKTTIACLDLPRKEKNDKRHKKDKAKEKSKNKEERDKEKHREKRKEKKERKERHKDNKEKDEKGEKQDLHENGNDREKLNQCGLQNNETKDSKYMQEKLIPNALQNNEIKDFKYVQELDRRVREEDVATGSQSVWKANHRSERRPELPGGVVSSITGCQFANEENAKKNDRQPNGQRNHGAARALDNGILGELSSTGHKRFEGIANSVEKKYADHQVEGKDRKQDSKSEKHTEKDRESKSKSKDKDRDKEEEEKKAKEIIKPSQEQPKINGRCWESTESHKDSPDSCNPKPAHVLKMSINSFGNERDPGKRKPLDMNGFLHENGLRPPKLPRPFSSPHLVTENGRKLDPCQVNALSSSGLQGSANTDKLDTKVHKINGFVEAQKLNVVSIRSAPSTVPPKENDEVSRKPSHDGSVSLRRSSPYTLPPTENGEASGKLAYPSGDVNLKGPSPSTLPTTENGEPSRKRSHPESVGSRKPFPSTVPTRKTEACRKPPHPDSKYLDELLSIPKIEECSYSSDQEWLFDSNCHQSKKPKVVSVTVDGVQQVWDQALRIESADVSALPYVIPY